MTRSSTGNPSSTHALETPGGSRLYTTTRTSAKRINNDYTCIICLFKCQQKDNKKLIHLLTS